MIQIKEYKEEAYMWTRAELKEKAKVALKQNYWKIVLVCVILSLIGVDGDPTVNLNYEIEEPSYYATNMIPLGEYNVLLGGLLNVFNLGFAPVMVGIILVTLFLGIAVSLFVFNPINVGARRFLTKSLNEQADMNELLFGFQGNYKNVVKVLFYSDLYILLWSLLLVVPGIIKAYEYFMVPYLLGENPNLDKNEALQMSKEMMYGHKWETFVLQLSFIGWDLLAAFTLGLVHVFYVTPYRNLTLAALFERLNSLNGYPARRANGYQQNYTTENI